MSRALDNLSKVVANTVKSESGVVITKDKMIDLIDTGLGDLYNVSQFFTALEDDQDKLQSWLAGAAKSSGNLKAIALYNKIMSKISGSASATMGRRFLGAMSDTVNAMIVIMEEVSGNIDKLFVETNLTIFNTKISQVAVIGVIENSHMFSEFCTKFIEALMYDRNQNLDKPERYVYDYLDSNLDLACTLMNRVLNNKLSNTFMSALLKYRSNGSDSNVVNSESKPTVQFARIGSEVTENDIDAGARGFKIFRIIGNWFSDMTDKRNRRKMALRDQLQARARLLQLELNGTDPDSSEYQRLVKIIANYQKQIDRLNQALAKYES